VNEDAEFWQNMAEKYKAQARAALSVAKEWESIAKERQELLEQIVMLTHQKNVIAVSLPTGGEA
jgi:hypothetical protein